MQVTIKELEKVINSGLSTAIIKSEINFTKTFLIRNDLKKF